MKMVKNEPKIEVLWKIPLEAESGFGENQVRIYKGNIFYISKTNRCVKVFDLKGNKKWEYKKEGITSYCFYKDVLALAIKGEGIEGLNLNGEHLWKYEYKDETNYIQSIDISDHYLVFSNWDFISFLELDKDNKWCPKWMCDKDCEFADVRIYKDNVFAVANDFAYCFDTNGNIKWKAKSWGNEYIEVIDENRFISWSGVWVGFHSPGKENIEFLPEDATIFGISQCGEYIGVSVEEWFEVEKGKEGYEIPTNTIAYVLDKNGKIVNKFVRERQKVSNPCIHTSSYSISSTSEHLALGTFDGYVYLFDINGKWKTIWHSPKIDEKWLKAHEPKNNQPEEYWDTLIYGNNHHIKEAWKEGIVYGNVYGDYYPIISLFCSDCYIAVLLPNEIILLKIDKS